MRFSLYILKQLFFTTVLVACILIGTLWIVQSLKFFDLVLKSQESFFSFFSLMVFALPDLLVIIIPIAVFVAVLFVYHRLHNDREMSVFYAAGFSTWDIARPALKFGIAATFLIYVINIFVLPWSFQKMRDLEYHLKKALPGILLQEGVFNSFNDLTIYVHEKKGNDLRGILAYVQNKNQKPSTFMAKEGRLLLTDNNPQIAMIDGSRQEYNPETKNLSILYFDQTVISLFEDNLEHVARPKKPYELSLGELLSPATVLPFTPKQRLYAEGYQRLLTPWYPFAFTLFALVFLLLTSFRKQAQSFAVIKSVISALLLQVCCVSLINLGANYWQAIWLAYLAMLLSIMVGLFYLRRKAA